MGKRSHQAAHSSRRHTAVPWLERLESRDLLSFFSPLDFAADYNPYAVAVGDLNGDGSTRSRAEGDSRSDTNKV
jgi:hypothetical protein